MKPSFEILVGDCRESMKKLPEKSIHCCITSPPYFNQRDYGVDGQTGLEKNADCAGWVTGKWCGECFVCSLIKVFREVKRVLRDDGTLWLNLGDKYSSGGRKSHGPPGSPKQVSNAGSHTSVRRYAGNLSGKQLLGTPWRTALALQAEGWVLRSDVIWHKTNAMMGSQKDRPTCAHEYMFLLAKREKYYFDLEAIKEKSKTAGSLNGTLKKGQKESTGKISGYNHSGEDFQTGKFRTKRSVWTLSVASEKESHFAVFPEKLILPCILASTSEKGCCKECGAQPRRILETKQVPFSPEEVRRRRANQNNRDPKRHVTEVRTTGWDATCECSAGYVPSIVLDPFGGSGTVAAAALKKGRSAVLCEINPSYVEIAKAKIKKAQSNAGFML